ncbi:MAG: glutathione-disulfide reductase [Hyphomonas sp.]|uniref:glutathione-disulfide reductase n=1 Tax=Hyphomonas sp. TaxID=87 RepID=UPI0017A3122B|nr:glutathione-disulfide reductase [Hyphomonas sp.]MBU3921864.1 glutathione-disulfide reductase [Alphaproteobacteria bacterium]MBA3067692.1 glutathione-disulfide reductase [Hyphomonas sp.]MBU4062221.1 glutathione-disulfide reductase [Alphaproteobacteria bacterium]MBU4165656.1 glutathione-disulfide reductase [Alphaproteobacteria bacterium]MBU4567403.1 glutathione-disulfide reductase [Alphaproteobacteria bacterium]
MTSPAYDYDLFVIGGGSGGVRAARIAAQAGAKVAVAEEYRMGGTCVVRGCVPKKFMVYASDYGKQIRQSAGFGWSVSGISYDHTAFLKAVHAEVDRLSAIYDRNLKSAGAEILPERAEFVDAHTLRLTMSGRTVTANRILIATGGHVWRPTAEELPGVEHTITSNEVFFLDPLPKRMLVAGGGFVALEFAHVFAGLGVDVTVIYRGEKILRGFDEDVRDGVTEGLAQAGIKLVTGTVFERIDLGADGVRRARLTNGSTLEAEAILMAVGRAANTGGLGCDKAGVALGQNGAVIVDDWSRTSAANIWAVGDVTDRVNLTPVAIREGHAFADTEFGGKPWHMDHTDIPTAVFTQPEVGTVGLSEADARAAFGEIDIYKTNFKPMKNALNGSSSRMLMKLVVRAADQRVLGVHIVGEDAAEMIQMVAIAVKLGATKQDFDRTCALHPSSAEELVTMRTKWVPEVA